MLCRKMKKRFLMKNKVLWITRTAAMLALLIALQWVTSFVPKPVGQYVTGSCVNAVLAMTALLCGVSSGLTVAVLSPVFAFLFGIAPNLVTVPAIMIGNAVFVALLGLTKKAAAQWQKIGLYLLAAVGKFGVLYVLVTYVICGVLAEELIAQGLLKAPMLNVLPASFALPQLITALIGGALALVTAPRIPLAHRPDRK